MFNFEITKEIAMNSNISLSVKRICASILLAGTITSFTFASTLPSKTDVSERAKKALSSRFPKAESIKWVENKNGQSYTAYFWLYDVKTVANYNQDGDLVSVLRYYHEDRLPMEELTLLKSKYADKSIAGITELTIGDDVSYYIKLEDNAHWYTVKISGDEMEQTERLNKQ